MKRRKPSKASRLKALLSQLEIAESHVCNLRMAIDRVFTIDDCATVNEASFTRLKRHSHLPAPYRNR